MNPEEAKTDAELVEACRQQMQDIIDRVDFEAPTREGLINSAGLPHRDEQIVAPDLTEAGRFDLDLPVRITGEYPKVFVDAMRRHWVYRHRDGRVVVLQLAQRLKLRALGFVVVHAFVMDTKSQN
jgi:hypothetical protein